MKFQWLNDDQSKAVVSPSLSYEQMMMLAPLFRELGWMLDFSVGHMAYTLTRMEIWFQLWEAERAAHEVP